MVYVKEALKPPEVWIEKYRKCPDVPQQDPKVMTPKEIQAEITMLLFDRDFQKKAKAFDRELLTIVILREKAHHFDFLRGYTTWKVVGMWEGKEEKNVQIDIEFKDCEHEGIGNRLMHLLWEYNHQVVKEDVLYTRTVPLEEGTLFV